MRLGQKEQDRLLGIHCKICLHIPEAETFHKLFYVSCHNCRISTKDKQMGKAIRKFVERYSTQSNNQGGEGD